MTPKNFRATITMFAVAATLAACGHEPDSPDSRAPDPARTAEATTDGDTSARRETTTQLPKTTAAVSGNADAAAEYGTQHPVVSGSPLMRQPSEPVDRENYAHFSDNPVHIANEDPVSTFSIDVDTGAYANVRRLLRSGQLPPHDAVRAEELINYFDYAYRAPRTPDVPFGVVTEVAPTPWNADTLLLHVGIQGYRPDRVPPANLVFLLDVSGSMNSPDKLGLLKSSLKLLVGQLDADDTVAIVVYAGASGVVLEPTPGDQRATIIAALDRLQAGGSTNGGAGIRLAYAMAEQAFIDGGINRVLLATDGDFNVGTTNIQMLKDLVAEQRERGIALTTLGFGTGNYNDHLMEQIADVGNGNYAYIDTLNEAQKTLVDQLAATTLTIAKDVKIQVEFNPAVVAEYRLIGYENRLLNREDFNNDRIDAGEIGAGHSVTALYEVTLAGSPGRLIDPLRYGTTDRVDGERRRDELAYLRMRYKAPAGGASELLEWPIRTEARLPRIDAASESFRFAAAVAAFAQRLRGGDHLEVFGYDDIAALAGGARGDDPFGYRGEFLGLVNLARGLSSETPVARRDER